MCVPKESAIAILMEAWDARGRYPMADKDLKKYYVEYVPPTQDDTPRTILVHPQPSQTQVSGSMPRQDLTNNMMPTGSDVNQSAPTPNTQNPKVQDSRNLAYREGEDIPKEDSTWDVMATIYRNTIKEFLKQG
jgi:hypothetical protein